VGIHVGDLQGKRPGRLRRPVSVAL